MSTDQDKFSDEDSMSDIEKDKRKSPGEKRKNMDEDPDDMRMFNEDDDKAHDQGEGEKIK